MFFFRAHVAHALSYASADITHNLIGWWKFDEGTSTRAHNSSGQGNNGTLSTYAFLPQWTYGKFGSALLFGYPNKVDTGVSSLYNFTAQDFTISFWEKSTNLANNEYIRATLRRH